MKLLSTIFIILSVVFISQLIKLKSIANTTGIEMSGKINVMIMDNWVNSKLPGLDNHLEYPIEHDSSKPDYLGNHGTSVTSIVLYGNTPGLNKICDEVKIDICTLGGTDAKFEHKMLVCLKRATMYSNLHYINISAGGSKYIKEEKALVSELNNRNVKIYAALGNDGMWVGHRFRFYPASYFTELKNVIPVMNLTKTGELNKISNRASGARSALGTDILTYVDEVNTQLFTGTSAAAPMLLHQQLQYDCKMLKEGRLFAQ
ncbi:MAG: hypothetical protein FMNOHCHN_03759 [Ignavibacteriaceae bacterium]|nr:hypothetical protein [Ignavibacteriaceae bacterium]